MEFGRAFTYIFEDQDWLKKVGIAALVILIPLIGPIVLMGWGLEITKRVIYNDPTPLPAWDDFGGFVSKGFQAFVVSLAYSLPIILISVCAQGLTIGGASLMSDMDGDTVGMLVTVVMLCFTCVVLILAIGVGIIIPAALGNLAATGELGAAFRFGEVLGMVRAAAGPYLLSILGVFLATLVLAPVGSLLCGVGALLASAYTSAVGSHLYGQAYNVAKGAAPTM